MGSEAAKSIGQYALPRTVSAQVVHVDHVASLSNTRVLFEVEPADVSEPETADRVVRICAKEEGQDGTKMRVEANEHCAQRNHGFVRSNTPATVSLWK